MPLAPHVGLLAKFDDERVKQGTLYNNQGVGSSQKWVWQCSTTALTIGRPLPSKACGGVAATAYEWLLHHVSLWAGGVQTEESSDAPPELPKTVSCPGRLFGWGQTFSDNTTAMFTRSMRQKGESTHTRHCTLLMLQHLANRVDLVTTHAL